jgi:DnaJ-class molecular chaperone
VFRDQDITELKEITSRFERGNKEGGGGGQRGPKRGQDIEHAIQVTLADLYKGKKKKNEN